MDLEMTCTKEAKPAKMNCIKILESLNPFNMIEFIGINAMTSTVLNAWNNIHQKYFLFIFMIQS